MEKNVKIPMRSIWSFLIALPIIGFTYIQVIGYVIPGFEKIFSLTGKTTTISDIGLIWVPVISYLLVASLICIILRIFINLKSYKEHGLIGELIGGLIGGLIWGLIVGFIVGFIGGLIGELIGGLIWGLIWGLIVGLIWGLIVGLIVGFIGGLINEFTNSQAE